MPEDAQPNEARHGRKGIPLVPVVRTTRPVGRFGEFSRGRGRGGPVDASHRTANNNHENAILRGSPRNGYWNGSHMPRQPNGFHPYVHRPPRQYGPTEYRPHLDPQLLRSQPSVFHPQAGPSNQHNARGGQNSAHSRNYKSLTPTPAHIIKEGSLEMRILNLPNSCQEGHSWWKREQWVKEQARTLEKEQGYVVVDYSYREDKVQFQLRRDVRRTATQAHTNFNGAHRIPRSQLSDTLDLNEPATYKDVREGLSHYTDTSPSSSSSTFVPGSHRSGSSVDAGLSSTRVQDLAVRQHDQQAHRPSDLNARIQNQGVVQTVDTIRLTNSNEDNNIPHFPISHPVLNKDTPPRENYPPPASAISVPQPHEEPLPRFPLHSCFSCRSGKLLVGLQRSSEPQAVKNAAVKGNSLPKSGVHAEFRGSHVQHIFGTAQADGCPQADARAHPLKSVEDPDVSNSKVNLKFNSTLGPFQGYSLPKYDKPRRLLRTSGGDLLSITAHGLIDRVECGNDRRWQRLLFDETATSQVDDACTLSSSPNNTYIVIGHARDQNEVSLYRMEKMRVYKLANFDRPSQGDKKCGISVVSAMIHPSLFATGGYDHRVHLWTVPTDVSRTSSQQLAVKHRSLVQALLPIRDTSHKLITAGADCLVNIWDIPSERVANTFNTSNSPHQAHDTSLPFCVLLEVAHRELQFEIRDYRMVPENPVKRFGYDTSSLHGRYVRGDIHSTYFTCGDRDGNVRLWDIRASSKPCAIRVFQKDGFCKSCSKMIES